MSNQIDPVKLRSIIPLRRLRATPGAVTAEDVTGLSDDSLKRHYPHLIKKMSTRRNGMLLADALAIADGSAA
jgi:hypothetical protein